MDVETMLTEAIRPLGGVPVRSIVGTNPRFDNADFLFRDDNVVAELKCLDVDQMRQVGTIEKASSAYLEEAMARGEMIESSNRIRTTATTASPTFLRKIRKLYEDPIKAAMKKANKQIKETRKALDLCDARGLLIIANNNNTALDPKHAREIIMRILTQESFSGINSVLYLTAGQQFAVPGWTFGHAILDIHRGDRLPAVDAVLIEKLRRAWVSKLSEVLGIPGSIEQVSTTILRSLTNKTPGVGDGPLD